MNLLRVVRLLRRGLVLIASTALIGAALGVAIGTLTNRTEAAHKTQTYFHAEHRFGLDTVAAEHAPSTELSNLNAIALLTDDPAVTSEIGAKLGGDGVALARRVTTVVSTNPDTLALDAVATTGPQAVRLAETSAAALLATYSERLSAAAANQGNQLAQRLAELKTRRAGVEAQLAAPGLSSIDRDALTAQSDALINQYRIAYDQFVSLGSNQTVGVPLYTLQRGQASPISAGDYQAALERGRVGANHTTDDGTTTSATTASAGSVPIRGPVAGGILGGLLGAFLGIGLVLLRDRVRTKLLTIEEFEDTIDVPVVAKIPQLQSDEATRHAVLALESPFGPAAEAYRAIRSSLMLLALDDAPRSRALVVMITSAVPSEGKSTTCANLAVTLAQAGRSVLAVNCDYRRPSLHRFFAIDDNDTRVVATAVRGLSVAPHTKFGATHPGSVAEYQRSFVESQRDHFDVILLDTSPVLSTSDPIDMLTVTDLVLLVGRLRVTERDQFMAAAQLLDRHRAVLAGVVVLGLNESDSAYAYYYRDAARLADSGSLTLHSAERAQKVAGSPERDRSALRWSPVGTGSNTNEPGTSPEVNAGRDSVSSPAMRDGAASNGRAHDSDVPGDSP